MHEEALAYELAAYLYLELGEINKSVDYFLLAHERYHEWVSSQVDFFSYVLYNVLLLINDVTYYLSIDLLKGSNREVQ